MEAEKYLVRTRALRSQREVWKQAAVGVLALSIAGNIGLYAVGWAREARHQEESRQLRAELQHVEAVRDSAGVPRCTCGGTIKPDVVLYEEGLEQDVIARAVAAIRRADVLIIGGTSLTVYPAAGLVQYYRGNKLAVVNKTALAGAGEALTICGPIGEVMAQL